MPVAQVELAVDDDGMRPIVGVTLVGLELALEFVLLGVGFDQRDELARFLESPGTTNAGV